jgi:hypothetical protein
LFSFRFTFSSFAVSGKLPHTAHLAASKA